MTRSQPKVTLASLLLCTLSFAGDSYDPQFIADMPARAERFVSRLTSASNRSLSVGRLPGASAANGIIDQYYDNRLQEFEAALDRNSQKFDALNDLINEATTTGVGGENSLNACLGNDAHRNSWGEFTNAVGDLGQLKRYVNSSVNGQEMTMIRPGVMAIDRHSMGNDVSSSYMKVAKYLSNKPNAGLFADIRSCCTKLGDDQSQVPLCNADHVRELLAPLAKLERLPSDFVDPLNPGPLAGTMNQQDIMTMISLGQMNDFVEARDFGEQIRALRRAQENCQTAREDALNKLGHEGQTKGLVQTGINTLHCALWSMGQNWSRGARSLALGFTKASVPLFNTVSQCPQEIQDQATLALTYSPQQFQNDYHTLGSLPGNIVYSSPVAMPIDVKNFGPDLMLEMRDEAGFTQDQIRVSGTALTTPTQPSVSGVSRAQNVANGRAVAVSVNSGTVATATVRGRSVVNGTGATAGAAGRVAVRGLAAKAVEGNLEASRSLASAVKGRKEIMQATLVRMKSDRSLVSKSLERGTAARALATTGTAVNVARGVSAGYSSAYGQVSRALAVSGTGRDIARPTVSTTAKNGSTVTPNYSAADRSAAAAYKKEQDKRVLAGMVNSAKVMADGINKEAVRLNEIITAKQKLIDEFRVTFDPGRRYIELTDLGADDRSAKLVSLNKEWARLVKEINILNTQELGMRVAVMTGENSLKNYLAGARAFQGLDVSETAIRGLASANTNDPLSSTGGLPSATTVNSNYNPGGLTPYSGLTPLGSAANQPINLMPPIFRPNVAGASLELPKFMRLFEAILFPRAYATDPREDRREKLIAQWDSFTQEYDRYRERLADQNTDLKQRMWDRFIVNERANRESNYLSTEVRLIVGSFNSAVREELPDLMAMKKTSRSGINPQVYTYLEQIRRESGELNELVGEEAKLSLDQRTMNPDQDEESWTGMLPAMALQ